MVKDIFMFGVSRFEAIEGEGQLGDYRRYLKQERLRSQLHNSFENGKQVNMKYWEIGLTELMW